jgi:nanoRNase/pAp phosphatase (c-di-AMP/oligoRNAs hydrolase)
MENKDIVMTRTQQEQNHTTSPTRSDSVALLPGPDGKRVDALYARLAAHEGERHAVILQDFPDPDAIACALAYQTLVDPLGIEVDILYAGRISHQENMAMIHLLGITLLPWNHDVPLPRGRYQGAVFLDNQGTTTLLVESVEAAEIPVIVVIDHHDLQDRLRFDGSETTFVDIRPVGACASILAHYLAEGPYPLKTTRPEHRKVATALMHGILSDTGSMIYAGPFDFAAAAYLQTLSDPDTLLEITQQQRSHKVMEVIRAALANRVLRENFCLSGVGYIRADERDAIPQAADFLLTEETVHTVIVYGVVVNSDGMEEVHGSLRTIKNTFSPDSFLKEALGKMPNGNYYGGGKARAGGFEIPLGFLSGQDDPDLAAIKWEAFNKKIRKKIFHRIGVEE